ncbi:MAG: ROK family protein [Armatimonadetes bacterium]|nr:ROK family protein [Armatimonadota bacterium]
MSNELLGKLAELARPRVQPVLDGTFRPAALANRAFRQAVEDSGRVVPLVIGLQRPDGTTSVYETQVFDAAHPQADLNLPYAERLVKFLLWQKGGFKVTIGGPEAIGNHIREVYSAKGARAFDCDLMGETTYERPFQVVVTGPDKVPPARETSAPVGRHLEGNRIGFDLGASDRKVAAVVNGEPIFSEEVVWDPRNQEDPTYHYNEINASLNAAAAKMPSVDAIGGSSAGIIINNRPMIASLFRGVPREAFNAKVKPIFLDLAKEWGVPFEVANDGAVTALAGSMSLNDNAILGVAMGSSEAAGYVNEEGNITGWLNELAFAPIDYHPEAPADEWSGDTGCGVQYLCQQGVFRLARQVGFALDQSLPLADQLKQVQKLLEAGDETARKIWETIGVYAGYAIAHYADFYTIKHLLLLGRVTSGRGGPIMIEKIKAVFATDFPELANQLEVHLPDEKTRRVGQAVAAASLPAV